MKSIKPEELDKNVFHMIGKEWLLVTAEKEGKVNTMTASWGGIGVLLIFYKLDKIYPRIITEMKQREAAEAEKAAANA